MLGIEERARAAYVERFGETPDLVASAPGRVNLIGEHTDYNGGFVLPCAIDRRVAVAVGRGGNELHSADFDETHPLAGGNTGLWPDYPRGVVRQLEETGYPLGDFRAAFAGDVPTGSGLSSSAAIEAATILALDGLFGLGIDRKEMARICMQAENEFVGVQSGIMDQYASLLCEAGAALLIDCRTLEAEPVPLDLDSAGLTLLVCDTRVERGLGDTGYNDRRAACERAARALGVRQLRDAGKKDLVGLSGDELKRARHVVSENDRVLAAVERLRDGDFEGFGRLMYASHRSMRDDYEISTRELDSFVGLAKESGALGARLTGAGFGGCAIALVPAAETKGLAEKVRGEFEARGFTEPAFYEFRPADGARVAGSR